MTAPPHLPRPNPPPTTHHIPSGRADPHQSDQTPISPSGPTEHDQIDAGGSARTADGHLGDHAQGALGADQQVLQVVAGVVLLHGGHAVQHVTIRHHLPQPGEHVQAVVSN